MKHRFLPVLRLLPIAALALLFNACGNDTVETDNDTTGTPDSGQTTNNSDTTRFDPGVPSPSEMLAFMKAAGAANANGDLLNPTENVKNYESKKAQSLNLGIYSADLLYAATFDVKGGKVPNYFGVCMKMGDMLKVATNLTDKDKDRISKNANNSDSLLSISNDLYLSSFENLENNQRGSDLSLMLAGGWVESVYLMSNMVKDFEKDKATAMRIGEQKSSLDNLVEYMSKYESNEDVKNVEAQLKELQSLMNEVQSSGSGGMQMKNGKRVLGAGGSKSAMTKEQFEKIKNKITEIRNSFTSAQ